MKHVTSADGTVINIDDTGTGPPVVLVGDGPGDRWANDALAVLLSRQFTVFNYDRRGRGENGDATPCAEELELEDIAAVIDAADGEPVSLYGTSSGAVLAFEAVSAGLRVLRLAMWEPPWLVNGSALVPSAHTAAVAGDDLPLRRVGRVGTPTLVLDGASSPAWMRTTAETVAHLMPNGRHCTLVGQEHDVDAAALAPVLTAFFCS